MIGYGNPLRPDCDRTAIRLRFGADSLCRMTTMTDHALSSSDLLSAVERPLDAAGMAERVTAATLGGMEMLAMHLGDRLGWYRALAAEGPLTSTELAHRTGTAERYAREWLEHQAASGYVAVEDATATAADRRYSLPAGHAEVLTDADSLSYLAPMPRMVVSAAKQADALIEAYRTGGGVSWEHLGADARESQAAINRPLFLRQLVQELLPQAPELNDLLLAGGRVADVGTGEGWSAIGLALGYPGIEVDGFDLDEPSIVAARRHAAGAGVSDQVRFHAGDAATAHVGGDDGAGQAGGYDAVFAFECIHDMGDPVSVLATMRRMVRPGGWVVVMDERTEDRFAAPASAWERVLYGYSISICLPDGMSHPGSVGTGTVMRPDVLDGYARDAGFLAAQVMPVEHDGFRFYRLVVS